MSELLGECMPLLQQPAAPHLILSRPLSSSAQSWPLDGCLFLLSDSTRSVQSCACKEWTSTSTTMRSIQKLLLAQVEAWHRAPLLRGGESLCGVHPRPGAVLPAIGRGQAMDLQQGHHPCSRLQQGRHPAAPQGGLASCGHALLQGRWAPIIVVHSDMPVLITSGAGQAAGYCTGRKCSHHDRTSPLGWQGEAVGVFTRHYAACLAHHHQEDSLQCHASGRFGPISIRERA